MNVSLSFNLFFSLLLALSFSCSKSSETAPSAHRVSSTERKKQRQTPLSSKQDIALKVGIAPFIYEHDPYQNSVLEDRRIAQIAYQGLDVLTHYLKKDQKLLFIEDASLNKLKKFWQKGDLAHLKHKYDYILLGTIKNFGKKELQKNQKIMAYSKVQLKLININTRNTVYQEFGDSQLSRDSNSSSDFTYLEDQALQQSILALAPQIQKHLKQTPWKGMIIEAYSENGEDFLVISSEKNQGLKLKQTLEVVMVNTDFKNPVTHTRLTMIGKSLALAEIVDFIPGKAGEGKTVCKVLGDQIKPFIRSQDFKHVFLRPAH